MASATATVAANSTSVIGTFPTDYTNSAACTAISSNTVVMIDSATSCLPEGFTTASTAYYSPAWDCPSGYTAQKSCTRSASNEATLYTVTCCPSRSNVVMSCVPDPESLSSDWVNLFCTWSAGDQETVVLVTSTSVLPVGDTTSITSAVTMSGGDGINAYGLRMLYEESDTMTSTTAATTTSSSSSATSATSAASTDESDDSSGGLSTGGIVALAVVIPLVVIAALVTAGFWRRRRRQQRPATELGADSERKELPPDTVRGELYGSQQYVSHELETPNVPVELPAGYYADGASQGLTPSLKGMSESQGTSPQFSVSAVSKSTPSPDGRR